MTTFKGAMRSYSAAVKRADKDQQRRTREAAQRFKEQQKQLEILNAAQAVSDWGNYVDTLQSIHKNCTEPIDWEVIRDTKKPIEPTYDSKNEHQAKEKLDNYTPTFFDKLFGSTQKKINKLTEQLELAKTKDQEDLDNAKIEYLDELDNWHELQEIASGIKSNEHNAYQKALEYFDPFSDLGELGTRISFKFENNSIDLDLFVNSLEVIPDYELKQTSTGKLSKKDMSKSRFNELYQDHICSASIRIARELFAYLPIDYARINALAKIVNTKTGHLEDQPILSVIFTPQTIEGLNLATIDPSDSMLNFVHNMNFNKTRGFSIVEKVELAT